jgi:4a-hydroxytetrahydrobiopterin dehydratase
MKKYDSITIQSKLEDISGWRHIDDTIERNFVFKDFIEAITNMLRIAFEAEAMNHHPEWTNVYNKLKIRLRTHDADGITENDFMLAKRINELIDDQ